MTDLSLNIKKTIHAPIEEVFDAWLDPAMQGQFVLPAPGMPTRKWRTTPGRVVASASSCRLATTRFLTAEPA